MFDRALPWFKNLPLGQKQFLALVICELIPLLGLGVGTAWVITTSLRDQLADQAQAELAVTETNYNIKINQMGFGSRGQSDNPIVIDAVKSGGTTNTPQIQQILRNEVQARSMEYATIVGADKKIIANAHTNRRGEVFDPNQLVTEALRDGQQIKASVIIPRSELLKESREFREPTGDALVRFVVTPIRDVGNDRKILGALIFGDMVNGKLPIVQNTRNAFGSGYSAVYQRSPDQSSFTLTTAIDDLQPNVPLPTDRLNLLTAAANAGNGKTVTDRLIIAGRTYTVAVRQLPDRVVEMPTGSPQVSFSAQAPAFLVRGSSEDRINGLLQNTLLQEALVLLLALALIGLWRWLFRKVILEAITSLSDAMQAFAHGDRTARAPVLSQDEIGQLAQQFNQMSDNLTASEESLSQEVTRQEQQTREAQSFNAIVEKMRGTLNFESVVNTAVVEIRSLMDADRVLIYQFNDRSFKGIAVAESVLSPFANALGVTIDDLLKLSETPDAETQPFWCVNDVQEDVKSDRHREHLARYEVKANLVAPIRRDKQLIGLLAVHQCRSPRVWQIHEMNLIVQLANQIGYALDQAQMLQQQQQVSHSSESLKNNLQMQIVNLIHQVESAASGDLTVRASEMSGDMGTIANSFNGIIENLQKLVIKVQDSTRQVNTLLQDDEGAVRVLSQDAEQQSTAVADFRSRLVDMTRSIDQVAESAQQATTVTQQANETAQANEVSMDLAVKKISLLRSTVEDTALKVRQLGQSSAQISRIVSLINEFAVQTDVLAVNAGLEANRAGEQGRGFAIIATEIGGLAARSSQAARDIAQIVEAIQIETTGLAEAMAEGTTQAADSSHQVRNAKQTLAQITLTSQKVNTLVQGISQAALTQSGTARSIQSLMDTVETLSTTTATTTHQVSKSLYQTIETAKELQRSVEIFKV
jgi:twitching motility protein PilJ